MSKRDQVLIESEQLFNLLEHPQLVLIDATVHLAQPEFDGDYRAASAVDEWRKQYIPRAQHLDQYQDFTDVDVEYSFAPPKLEHAQHRLRELGIHQESQIVIYDSKDGMWASRLWWVLKTFGLKSRILNGGLSHWLQKSYPTISGDESHNTEFGDVVLNPQAHLWVDKADVIDVLHTQQANLICALGKEQFQGTVMTRYSRRGAIPQSLNVPARQFIQADNRFIANAEIIKILKQIPQDKPHVLYCGGGISACILAVAFELVAAEEISQLQNKDQIQQISMYDGSLQEWSADSTLTLLKI